MRRLAGEQGFTLLEVLVAFVIMASALMVLFGLFGAGMDGMASATAERNAVLLAEARLDRVGVETPLRPGDYSGMAEHGFTWMVAIRPYDPGDTGPKVVFYAFWVQVTVLWTAWGRERRFSLATLRLVAKP